MMRAPLRLDRRRFGLLGLGAAVAGCDGSPASRADQKAVRMAFGATIESLDPVMTINAYPLFRSLFDSLTNIEADGSLAPGLARSWSSDRDATVWTFRIRTDARWSDGAPVTVDDLVFTFNAIRESPASLNHQYLTMVSEIETIGPELIRFTLARPFAAWPRQLTLLPIVPKSAYQTMGADAFAQRPIGSGPYALARWAPGGALELVANPHHAGGPPPAARVAVLSVPDEAARLNGLQSGDLDAITLTPQQAPLARARRGVDVVTARGNRVVYLGFTTTEPPLDDVRVRQAIDCAIDRGAICRYLLRGSAYPIGQLVAPCTFGYDPAMAPLAYDPPRARALLAAAGYAGAPIVFQYPTSGALPMAGLVAEAVEGYLHEVGLNIRMRGLEQNTFIGDWLGRKLLGLFLFAFNPSTMDAGLVTASLIGPSGVRSFDDPALDDLEALQQSQADPIQRAATFGRIWVRTREKAYYAPLFNDSYVYATRRDKVALTPRDDGYITAQDLKPTAREVAESPASHPS